MVTALAKHSDIENTYTSELLGQRPKIITAREAPIYLWHLSLISKIT